MVSAVLALELGSAACSSGKDTVEPSASTKHTAFVEGCDEFDVIVQNRWDPLGAAIRPAPDVDSGKVGSFGGNDKVEVDGWVETEPAYPNNGEPWNSDVWFHLEDGLGWLSFAAVRGEETTYDPTGLEDGGKPAPTPAECETAYQP